ncbi:MAG: 3-hydroxyacyl-CoA dehydrogenase NAD-binding domain-containing protein [Fuerstiella sp.]
MPTTDQELIRTVGIIGAGVMGRGIAELSARAGLQVRIYDETATVAMSAVHRIQAVASDALMVSLATCEAEVAAADLIIEAVPEDFGLKTIILSRVEPHLNDGTIVASNSSSLSIAQLGTALRNPSRFCGLHFCHPVNERPLVEVIGTDVTSCQTVSRAYRYATDIGMAPIIVRDSPGFLLNRLLVPYMNESLELLLHGADVESLDRAAQSFGMPLRPLSLFDEFGFDVAMAVGRSLIRAYPDRVAPSELLIAMYKSGRRGRKSGGGFYLTAEDAGRGRVDPSVVELIHKRRHSNVRLSDDIVMRRLILPVLLEATRVLQESLVTSPGIIDTALRDGLGMTPVYTGLFAWANAIGARTIVEWLQTLQPLGKRFEPTELLRNSAKRNSLIGEPDLVTA